MRSVTWKEEGPKLALGSTSQERTAPGDIYIYGATATKPSLVDIEQEVAVVRVVCMLLSM